MLDSNQISQAIISLCINARDAMTNGAMKPYDLTEIVKQIAVTIGHKNG